jgi:hypothetical protein
VRVIHKSRLVFLSNPRCGSTSVRRVLDPFSDVKSGKQPPLKNHMNAAALKSYFDSMGWIWTDYTSFTTIRNPWSRVVSCYSYGTNTSNSVWRKRVESAAGDFEEFVRRLPNYNVTAHQRTLRVEDFAFSADDGKQLVDRIFRVEDLDRTLPPFLARFGIQIKGVPHINTTEHASYRALFTEESKERVREFFAKDIALGNYRF